MRKIMVHDKHNTDENSIVADHHTLFIEEVPMTFEPVLDPDGVPIEKIYEQIGGYTNYKLFMGDFDEQGNGTQRIINKLQNSIDKDSNLEIHISSYGGSVDELLEYYHAISSMYYENCVTYLSMGYSAGAIAFLFGKERVCYEHSDWMIHSYSGGAVGKRDDMLRQLAHTDARIQHFFKTMLEPYFTEDEMKEISRGDDFWLNSKEMLERGIATHIVSKGNIFEASEYLDMLDPTRITKREEEAKEKEKAKAKKAAASRRSYAKKKAAEVEEVKPAKKPRKTKAE